MREALQSSQSVMCTSVPQTEAWAIFTRTSSGPGWGGATSTQSKPACGDSLRIAFIRGGVGLSLYAHNATREGERGPAWDQGKVKGGEEMSLVSTELDPGKLGYLYLG